MESILSLGAPRSLAYTSVSVVPLTEIRNIKLLHVILAIARAPTSTLCIYCLTLRTLMDHDLLLVSSLINLV